MKMRSNCYMTKTGILVIGAILVVLWMIRSSTVSLPVLPRGDPWSVAVSTPGKAVVLQHNGVRFERLLDFCTWTLEFDCHQMKTPAGRIPFYIHQPGTDGWMSDIIAKDEERDPKEIAVVMRELRSLKDPMFVDIGSNLGVYSMVIATNLKIPVISVDPLVENVVRLCKSVQANKLTENMTVIYNALADKHEIVGFSKPYHHIAASKVKRFSDAYVGGPNSCTKPTSVITCTLDDLLPLMKSKIAVLKIDAEGHEYKIISGGQKFLNAIDVPVIFMEWNHVKQTPGGKPLADLLKKTNYVPFPIEGDMKGAHLEFDKFLDWPFNVLWVKKL